jgi:hypothetical protein
LPLQPLPGGAWNNNINYELGTLTHIDPNPNGGFRSMASMAPFTLATNNVNNTSNKLSDKVLKVSLTEFEIAKFFDNFNKQCASHAFAREFALALANKVKQAIIHDSTKNTPANNNNHNNPRYSILLSSCELLIRIRTTLVHSCILLFFSTINKNNHKTLWEYYYTNLNNSVDSFTEEMEQLARNHKNPVYDKAATKLKQLQETLKTHWIGYIKQVKALLK